MLSNYDAEEVALGGAMMKRYKNTFHELAK